MNNCQVLLMISMLSIIVLLVSDSYELSLEDSIEESNEDSYEGLTNNSDIKWIDVGSDTLYSIDSTHATWQEADENCKKRGKNGRLATLDSEPSLISFRKGAKGVYGRFWIGIQEGPTGVYQRIGGIQSDFFNWAPEEPNNVLTEKCVELVMKNVLFNSLPCNTKMPYICVSDKKNRTTSVNSTSVSPLNDTDSADWIDIGTDTLYTIEFTLATWKEAFENCKLKGINGRLASIDSRMISDRLRPYIKEYEMELWIGIYKGPSGAFVRTGSAQSRFFNWKIGQPDNWGIAGEDCVELYYYNMKWNDAPCDFQKNYLCASDKDPSFSTISTIPKASSSDSETTLATSDSTDWIDIGTDTLYFIEPTLATWRKSFENCKLKGINGRLASIDHIKISDLLQPYILDAGVELWIGLYKGPTGAFLRTGSAESKFFNWDKGQPDDWQLAGEDCVELYYNNMKWNDAPCHLKKYYLCASDKDTSFSTISSIPKTTSSVSETTLTTSVNSMSAPLITLTRNGIISVSSTSASSLIVTESGTSSVNSWSEPKLAGNGIISVSSTTPSSLVVTESGTSSVNSWSEPMLADIAKECHAALTAICFLIVFVFLVFVVALVLKRWPLTPQVKPFDNEFYCQFSKTSDF